MQLFRVTFEQSLGDKLIESPQFYCAEKFSQVYERAKAQEDENNELVEIKRLVPVLGVIKEA